MRYTVGGMRQPDADLNLKILRTISLSVEFSCRARDRIVRRCLYQAEEYALVGLHSDILDTLLLLGHLSLLCDLQHSLQCIDEEDGDKDERNFQL